MSLPTRERGLKSHCDECADCLLVSLPTRERGLKYEQDKNDATNAGRSLRGSVD